MPGYKYDGTATNDGFAYNSIKQTKGYTYAGVEIPLQEEHNIFYGKKWLLCGDSNFTLNGKYAYYVGKPIEGSDYVQPGKHTQQMITDAIDGLTLYTSYKTSPNTTTYYANGGHGILNNYQFHIPYMPIDTDVVMMVVSPNDWKAVNNNLTDIKFNSACIYGTQVYDKQGRTKPPIGALEVDNCVAPADDSYRAGQQTVVGQLNDLFEDFYNHFYGIDKPNKAKLAIINGYPYPIGLSDETEDTKLGSNNSFNNKGYTNIMKVMGALVDDWLSIDKLECNSKGWLCPTLEMLRQVKLTKSSGRKYKMNADSMIYVPQIIEKDPESPFYNRTIEPWHMTKYFDSTYTYAPYYAPYNNSYRGVRDDGKSYSTSTAAWGHVGWPVHERFFSPIISHLLAHALAPELSDTQINSLLPTELQYNNI